MFDHVKIGVSDYAASKAFFLKALEPLGVAVVSEGSPAYGVELCPPGGTVSLCLYQAEEKPAPLHLAFVAANRGQVDDFHRAALAAGGKDNGAPGLRPRYSANYYAAFVIGPDGHNIEAVCHEPVEARTSVVLAPGEGRAYPMGRISAVFKADEAETQSRYSVSEWWLEPKTQGPGPHSHPEDDLFYTIEGVMSIRVGEAWHDCAKGAFVLVPGGVTHDFENRGSIRAGVLNFSAPGPFEPEMAGIAQWFTENPPKDTA